ncbi:hypothetical protein VFPPC_18114 [Pochonia chlamydosporia 170]|uniref:Uncharacterized protein n=1 Tax=Pochonia chlamydosporia 170 TaxID=1380566 RepID=A0A219APS5_METCM|nr:hypothetical protein VFPPC_18114 [Pochonia chlamydosporia 170]OWT42701.1 hypothetical protein VFPPC_18114 [Pochonia chlamydosporia 170]
MQSSSGWTWKNLVFNSPAILPFNAEETSAIRCRMYGARVSILSHGMYGSSVPQAPSRFTLRAGIANRNVPCTQFATDKHKGRDFSAPELQNAHQRTRAKTQKLDVECATSLFVADAALCCSKMKSRVTAPRQTKAELACSERHRKATCEYVKGSSRTN